MRRSLLIVLLTLLAAWPASAVTVAPLSFEELVRQSSAVVYARVIDVRGQWSDDRRRIDSLVTVEVIKGLKGPATAALTLTVPGGQVGRYRNVMPGAPSFARGDHAVLFLTARGPRLPVTTGFTQGIYRVLRDTASGTALVAPPAIEPAGAPIVRGDRRRVPVSLDAFEAAVRAVRDLVR
ncbi:MAG: hypothetical protein Q8O42_23320 [Acidobacteriota bacterium]|nr:hypothetical protein [Acidobacteriota bacterium]